MSDVYDELKADRDFWRQSCRVSDKRIADLEAELNASLNIVECQRLDLKELREFTEWAAEIERARQTWNMPDTEWFEEIQSRAAAALQEAGDE